MKVVILLALWCGAGATTEDVGARACTESDQWLSPVKGNCSAYIECSKGHLFKRQCPLPAFFGFDRKDLRCKFKYLFSKVRCDDGNSTANTTTPFPEYNCSSTATPNIHHTVTTVTPPGSHSSVAVITTRTTRNFTISNVTNPSHHITTSSERTETSTSHSSTWSSVQINSTIHVLPNHNETTTPKIKPKPGSGVQMKVNGWMITLVIIVMLAVNI